MFMPQQNFFQFIPQGMVRQIMTQPQFTPKSPSILQISMHERVKQKGEGIYSLGGVFFHPVPD